MRYGYVLAILCTLGSCGGESSVIRTAMVELAEAVAAGDSSRARELVGSASMESRVWAINSKYPGLWREMREARVFGPFTRSGDTLRGSLLVPVDHGEEEMNVMLVREGEHQRILHIGLPNMHLRDLR